MSQTNTTSAAPEGAAEGVVETPINAGHPTEGDPVMTEHYEATAEQIASDVRARREAVQAEDAAGPAPESETSRALVAIDPVTGEILDLKALTTTDLAEATERARGLIDEVFGFRQRIVDEVSRRMDRENSRSAVVGSLKITTNAPVKESYPIAPLRAALQALVDADVLEASVIDRVITEADPKPPEPKVAARELNKLKGHDDQRVAAAIGAVRQRDPQRRTLKVELLDGPSA